MRTRPLPQRHAYDLSLFAETIQATLNRNKSKGDLGAMSFEQITDKIEEEYGEIVYELRFGGEPARLEREAADLAVCALAVFVKARNIAREGLDNG